MKYKKPNLRTLEQHLVNGDIYTMPNGNYVKESKNGYFMVVKEGISRTHERLVDAWRSL